MACELATIGLLLNAVSELAVSAPFSAGKSAEAVQTGGVFGAERCGRGRRSCSSCGAVRCEVLDCEELITVFFAGAGGADAFATVAGRGLSSGFDSGFCGDNEEACCADACLSPSSDISRRTFLGKGDGGAVAVASFCVAAYGEPLSCGAEEFTGTGLPESRAG